MRLATITNWAYGATVALTLASGATMLFASAAQEHERAAVAQRYALDSATGTVDEDVGLLSDLAREYAITGDPADRIAYSREAGQLGPVESRTRGIHDAGASPDELASLHEAMRWADALQDEQREAIAARQNSGDATAIRIMFSPEYERELDRIQAAVRRFQYRIDQRTDTALRQAIGTSRLWRATSEVMLAITGLVFLFVLYFIFRRRVLRPVVTLSDVVGRLAAQDFEAEPPQYDQIDEIGDMAQALRVFRENGIERQRLEQERDADRARRDLLSRMTQRMQGCDTVDDLKQVVRRFMPAAAPDLAGRLYLLDATRGVMVEACSWLDPRHSGPEFPLLACWALRRGAPHRATGQTIDVPCEHVQDESGDIPDSLCLPLVGQRGTLGLLYLEPRADRATGALPDIYMTMLAENLSLALDNLMLRDALRSLAMADPLTMLANRRQLDGQLEASLAAAERSGTPICCAMIDIDHFKRFNDDHGHAAGDAVLRAVATTLKQSVREGQLVFRYGGEEFLMLLPGVSIEVALARTQEVAARIGALRVHHEGRELGPVTASIGLASAPEHCEWQRLVQTADAALLQAKRAGRNRVVVATEPRNAARSA